MVKLTKLNGTPMVLNSDLIQPTAALIVFGGTTNLFFLPFAGKMRIQLREEHLRREMMLEGVISIIEGMNPHMLEIKLAGFLNRRVKTEKERAA